MHSAHSRPKLESRGRGKPITKLQRSQEEQAPTCRGVIADTESLDSQSEGSVEIQSQGSTDSAASIDSIAKSFSDMMSIGSRGSGRKRVEELTTACNAALIDDTKMVAVHERPDFGKKGRKVTLETNFFVEKLPKDLRLHRYIITVNQLFGFRKRDLTERCNKLDREDRRAAAYCAYEKLLVERPDVFKEPWTMYYDRNKLLFSLHEIQFEGPEATFKVCEVRSNIDGPGTFEVTFQYLDHVLVNDAKALVGDADTPMKNELTQVTPLQILDIITSQTLYYNGELTPFGRAFFRPNDVPVDLGHGRTMHSGFVKANRPILGDWKNLDQMPASDHCVIALNVDSQKSAFYKPIGVLDFLKEVLKKRNGTEIRSLNTAELKLFQEHIKGVFVESNFRNGSRVRFCVHGVTHHGADKTKFLVNSEEGTRQVSVAAYFKDKYDIQLSQQFFRYTDLPCLQERIRKPVDKSKSKFQWTVNYYPLELFLVSQNQRVNYKRVTEEQSREIIKSAAVPPEKRKAEILKILDKDLTTIDYNVDRFSAALGIDRATEMLKVDARIITPPKLNYAKFGAPKVIVPIDGSWDPRDAQFVFPSRCDSWVLTYFDESRTSIEQMKKDIQPFASCLARFTKERGMRWPDFPVYSYEITELSQIEGTFKQIVLDQENQVDIIVCIVSKTWKTAYPEIKRVSEVLFDIPTQVICANTVFDAVRFMRDAKTQKKAMGTFIHLTQKLNQKLGGINQNLALETLEADVIEQILKQSTIFIGADVTHPPPQSRSEVAKGAELKEPSIAAIVGSKDSSFANYGTVIQVQDPRREIIDGLEEAVCELVQDFVEQNRGTTPEKLIFLRDGVSDGQFADVLTNELPALLSACQKILGYQPGVTIVIVQKRHHTRFFPTGNVPPRAFNAAKNIQPGTVVDTGPVHPQHFEFYLASHAGIQGTSKATKYVVIYDTNKFTQDVLQHLVYYLTHVYGRCNKSISLPAPVMYAHLAAARAKHHLTGLQRSSTEGSSDTPGNMSSDCGLDSTLVEQLKDMEKAVRVGKKLQSRLYYA